MAIDIPLPQDAGTSLLQGADTGSALFARIMQPIIQRQQLAQQMKIHMDDLALRKAAAGRAAANYDLQRQLMMLNLQKAQREANPLQQLQYNHSLMDGIKSMRGAPQDAIATPMTALQGMGMPAAGAIDDTGAPVAPPDLQTIQQGFGGAQATADPNATLGAQVGGSNVDAYGLSPDEQMALSMAGVKLPTIKETPQQKMQREIQTKSIEAQNAADVKETAALKNDLPQLEASLKSVQELKRIAKDNPKMFGHTFLPDLWAKTNNIKDFGRWQNLISDAIVNLEQKMSSRGNVVALKMSSQLKPTHAEQQEVAQGKLDSMEDKLIDRINVSRQKLGMPPLPKQTVSQPKYNDSDLVKVQTPTGEQIMTYKRAKELGAE